MNLWKRLKTDREQNLKEGRSMLLIILTLCSQPVGVILQDNDLYTMYSMEGAYEYLPEKLPHITSSVTIPIDGLTKTGHCA